MRKFSYQAMQDLINDFYSAFEEKKVDLTDMNICTLEKIDDKIGDKNRTAVICVTNTGLQMSNQEIRRITVPKAVSEKLEHIGCFYETDNRRYIPSYDVMGRVLYDYFKINTAGAGNGDGLMEDEDIIGIAEKFRKVGKIYFISQKIVGRYYELIGMRSANNVSTIGISDIISEINSRYGEKAEFFTSYTDRKNVSMDFGLFCRINKSYTKNKCPLYLYICDNVTGRKSISIDVVTIIKKRRYVLDNMDLNHKTVSPVHDIVNDIMEMVHSAETKYVGSPTYNEIEEACMQHLPKRAQEAFKRYLKKSPNLPMEAAYDVMKTNIFNMNGKNHKTSDYDGGKRNYELALGKTVLKI